jgi:hypothetical protein
MQLVSPKFSWYFPDSHNLHLEAPVPGAYEPGWQASHEAALAADENLPSLQGVQAKGLPLRRALT